jgi:hypothetical protein
MSGFKNKRVRPQQGIGAPFSSLEGSKFGADTSKKQFLKCKNKENHVAGTEMGVFQSNQRQIKLSSF